MKKYLYCDYENCGIIGEPTGYLDLHIGDMLNIKEKDGSYEYNLIVVFEESRNRYSLMGLLVYDLPEIFNRYEVEKLASYKIINNGNIRQFSNFNFEIKYSTTPKLTLQEIRDELGYDFELIDE